MVPDSLPADQGLYQDGDVVILLDKAVLDKFKLCRKLLLNRRPGVPHPCGDKPEALAEWLAESVGKKFRGQYLITASTQYGKKNVALDGRTCDEMPKSIVAEPSEL